MMRPGNKDVKTGLPSSFRQALSLTELVVIVFLVGLGTALVIPLAGGQGNHELTRAAYRIISDLQYVQGQAIGTRKAQSLFFDVAQGEYSFPPAGNPSGFSTDPLTKKDYRVFFKKAVTNTSLATKPHADTFPGVELVSATFGSESRLYFDTLGLPTDSGGNPLSTAVIQIRGNTLTRTLSIDTTTGRVTIN